jgi:hypothetical protein
VFSLNAVSLILYAFWLFLLLDSNCFLSWFNVLEVGSKFDWMAQPPQILWSLRKSDLYCRGRFEEKVFQWDLTHFKYE